MRLLTYPSLFELGRAEPRAYHLREVVLREQRRTVHGLAHVHHALGRRLALGLSESHLLAYSTIRDRARSAGRSAVSEDRNGRFLFITGDLQLVRLQNSSTPRKDFWCGSQAGAPSFARERYAPKTRGTGNDIMLHNALPENDRQRATTLNPSAPGRTRVHKNDSRSK